MHIATNTSLFLRHTIQLNSEQGRAPAGLASAPPTPGDVLLLNYFSKIHLPPRLQRQYSWESLAVISGQPTKRGSSGGMLCLSVAAIWAEGIWF